MDDHGQHEKGILCENYQSGFSDSDDSDESNEKLNTKPLNKEEEAYEGGAFVNKKPRHEISGGSSKKINVGEENGIKSSESNHEIHLRTERERRKKMRNMFSSLHALLPELPSKVDQITIVSEAMKYINSLEKTLEMLEKRKQERLQTIYPFKCESSMINSRETFIGNHGSCNNMACATVMSTNPSNSTSTLIPQHPVAFQTWCSPNVVLNICGNEAQLCVYTTKKLDLMTTIASVLDKHNIEVVVANIWCNDNGKGCMILAQTNIVSSHQFPEATFLEQVYKQAAEEIKLLIS